MKKLLIELLAILLCFSLVACKNDDTSSETTKKEESTTTEVVETPSEETKQEETTVEETVVDGTEIKEEVNNDTAQTYWVNFLNYDGSVLQRTAYKAGETPKYNGSTPTYSDGAYTYTFTGWDKAFSPVTMTQTYTAVYTRVAIPVGPTIVNPVAKTGLKYDGTAQELITAGSGAAFTYSIDNGVTYSATIPTATDAGTYQIKYKKDGVDAGTLVIAIAKRPITITSGSDSKAYDGTSLKNSKCVITSGSLASGHGMGTSCSGLQTIVGSSDNTFTCHIFYMSGGLAVNANNNYDITYVYGTLTVY